MGQGDLPTPRRGPLRRRRERRQLEQLAEASTRVVTPTTLSGHIKIVEDQVHGVQVDGRTAERDLVVPEPDAPVGDSTSPPTTGFRVRPVPIDEPIGE
jgi:hypothetical protein